MTRRLMIITIALTLATAAALLGSAPAPAASSTAIEYREVINEQFGFATYLPGHWVGQVKKDQSVTAIIVSGPQGSEDSQTTINFQFIPRSGQDTLAGQVADLEKQFGQAEKYKLISKEKGKLAGQPAYRLVVAYRLAGEKTAYGQEQYVTVKGKYFYWIGYTAPIELFDKYRDVINQAISRFRFLP